MRAVRRADFGAAAGRLRALDERQRTRLVLGLLTLVFVCTGLAFAIGTPLFQNPDEPTHVDLARYYSRHPTQLAGPSLRQTQGLRAAIAATGLRDEALPPDFSRLPETRPDYLAFGDYPGGNEPATSGCPVSCQNYQYGHPPGWYLFVAPLASVTDRLPFPSVVLTLRVFDVLLASVVVWCTWYVARQVWPDRPRRALVAAALTACCGPLAGTAAAANNDALMLALMAVAFAVMARVLRAGNEAHLIVLLGTVVALGLLTKGEFLPVAVIAFAVVAVAWQRRRLHGPRWRTFLVYLGLAGAGALWWLRVLVDAHSLTPRGSEIVSATRPGPWQSVGFTRYVIDRIPEFVERFPGVYGWFSVKTPRLVQVSFLVLVVALAAGWLLCRHWTPPRRSEVRFVVLAVAPVVLFLAAAYSSYATYHRNGDIRGFAPRYVYGAIPLLAVGATAAVATVASRLRPVTATTVRWFVVGASVLGGMGSFVIAMHGQYATWSPRLLAGRAGVVAPVAHPMRWLALVVLVWLAAALAAAWLLATDWEAPVRRGRDRPTQSTTGAPPDREPASDGAPPRSEPAEAAATPALRAVLPRVPAVRATSR